MVLDKNEYKKAAKRHLDTCRYMLDHLGEIKPTDNYSKDNILMDIYYLSGYIIECAGSFGMLHLGKKLPPIHNFQHNIIPTLEREYPKLALGSIIEDSGLKETLYRKWNTRFRYEKPTPKEFTLSKENVEKFYTLSISIYFCIIKKL